MPYNPTKPNHIYLIYMCKEDLALDNQKWLICYKILPNQINKILTFKFCRKFYPICLFIYKCLRNRKEIFKWINILGPLEKEETLCHKIFILLTDILICLNIWSLFTRGILFPSSTFFFVNFFSNLVFSCLWRREGTNQDSFSLGNINQETWTARSGNTLFD